MQTLPAAPVLQIAPSTPASVRLSWDAMERDWVLEGAPGPLGWSTVLTAPKLEGNEIALTLPATRPSYFWRLRAQQTSGAAGGRNFLRDSQGNGGIWGAGGASAILQSAASLESLMRFAAVDPSIDSAVQFGLDALTYYVPLNNDDLSRTIIALAAGDRSVTSLVDSLLASQNPEISSVTSLGYPGNGWGVAQSLGDTTIDTALALRAFVAAEHPAATLGLSVVNQAIAAGTTSPPQAFTVPPGATGMFLHIRKLTGNARFNFTTPSSSTTYFDATPGGVPVHVNFGTPAAGSWSLSVVNNAGTPITCSAEVSFTTAEGFDVSRVTGALSFLAMAQNADGGWGIFAGSDSHLMITYEVMKALATRSDSFASALSAGASWLANSKRNPDGGFSSEAGASNVLETALAVLAIRLSGQPVALDTALGFIRNAQLLNGSWQEDPYTTALATSALAQPPLLSPIPDQHVVVPNLFTQLNLDNIVADPDHADSAITWAVSGQSTLSVSVINHVATITYPAGTELSETLTFTATDPDGLSAATTATFSVGLAPLVDYTIARGGSVTGTRSFTTTPANFSQIASYNTMPSGLATGVTYTTTNVWLISPDTIEVDFQINVGAGAAIGFEEFTATYGLKNSDGVPLVPLFNSTFNIKLNITP